MAGGAGGRAGARNVGWSHAANPAPRPLTTATATAAQTMEGGSKGCGIVEFSDPAEALHAISLLSNSTLGGRQVRAGGRGGQGACVRGRFARLGWACAAIMPPIHSSARPSAHASIHPPTNPRIHPRRSWSARIARTPAWVVQWAAAAAWVATWAAGGAAWRAGCPPTSASG